MVNRNKNGNDAAANNDSAMLQEVKINIGGDVGGAASAAGAAGGSNGAAGAAGDCWGKCNTCYRNPIVCPIAALHLPKQEYFDFGG
jgi:hypothetical protein